MTLNPASPAEGSGETPGDRSGEPPREVAAKRGRYARLALGGVLVPLVLYFLLFCALTWPAVTHFSTHYFGSGDDALTNVWNYWWTRKALLQYHTLPWFTREIHHPHGVWLLGHTLNLWNGLLALPLLSVLPQHQVYNTLLVGAFITSGLTAFWLAWDVSRSYAGALFAGAVFAFCPYQFAHAEGHMNLISLEWMPVYLLLVRRLILRPTPALGLGAALALFAVTLCDLYYLIYCAFATIVMALWVYGRELTRARGEGIADAEFLPHLRRMVWPRYRRPALWFAGGIALTSGALVGLFMAGSTIDPYAIGGHPAEAFSMDLFALVVPGGHWRFSELTRGFWQGLPGTTVESTVHVGLPVLLLACCGLRKRERPERSGGASAGEARLWGILLLVFAVLALGPKLQAWGKPVDLGLPYAWLETLLPPLRLGGTPVRMAIMVALFAGVLGAVAWSHLARRGGWGGLLLAVTVALTAVHYLPPRVSLFAGEVPGHVRFLAALPGREGVLDDANGLCLSLYYQTIYDKPQVFGYISRYPRSVKVKNNRIRRLMALKRWGELYPRHGVRWLIAPRDRRIEAEDPRARLVYAAEARVYDLSGSR